MGRAYGAVYMSRIGIAHVSMGIGKCRRKPGGEALLRYVGGKQAAAAATPSKGTHTLKNIK